MGVENDYEANSSELSFSDDENTSVMASKHNVKKVKNTTSKSDIVGGKKKEEYQSVGFS